MSAPRELVVNKGKVTRKAGNTAKYIAAWQRKRQIADGTHVCIIDSDTLQKLYNELEFLRQITTCA